VIDPQNLGQIRFFELQRPQGLRLFETGDRGEELSIKAEQKACYGRPR
jgi:hypothetical protein